MIADLYTGASEELGLGGHCHEGGTFGIEMGRVCPWLPVDGGGDGGVRVSVTPVRLRPAHFNCGRK